MFTLAFPSKINAIAIYMFCAFVLFFMIKRKSFKWKNTFVVLSFFFFSFHVAHVFFDVNTKVALFEVEKKLTFLLLPLFWFNLPVSNPKVILSKALKLFGYGMSVFGLGLLLNATLLSNKFTNLDVFFYHNFSQLMNGNAIYASLLFTISLIVFIDSNRKHYSPINIGFIAFNSLIIILLSSKTYFLILAFLLIYQLNYSKRKLLIIGLVSISGLVLFLANENTIVNRFKEIKPQSIFALKTDINTNTRFDGFSLRKELWDMSLETIEEDKASFWLGAGPGDAQDKLNEKIKERNLYIGSDTKDSNGYLNYNSHNQYLQTMSEIGAVGLFLLIFMLFYFFHLAIKSNDSFLILFNILIVVSYFTESYLSRQIGIISFVGFYSMIISTEKETSQKEFKALVKRVFDIVFANLVIVLLLSWLLPILGILIYLDTKAFPIFVQSRAGKNSIAFNCFKLRTMIKNREANNLPAQKEDIRITKLGAFLRRYAIDELPQFFNVFLGQMSVVGPRPLMVKEEIELNERIPHFSSRLTIKPGVTGLAQANGYKGIIDHDADLNIRYRLDLLYIKRQSLWVDIKIIIRTITYLFQ